MKIMRFTALLSLFAMAAGALYWQHITAFAVFYTGALIFGEISGRKPS